MPHRQRHARGLAGKFHAAFLETARVDATLDEFAAQDVEHLVYLELGLGLHLDDVVARHLETGVHALEIEPVADFPIRLIERIRDFVHVDFRDDIERWHMEFPRLVRKGRSLSEGVHSNSRRMSPSKAARWAAKRPPSTPLTALWS